MATLYCPECGRVVPKPYGTRIPFNELLRQHYALCHAKMELHPPVTQYPEALYPTDQEVVAFCDQQGIDPVDKQLLIKDGKTYLLTLQDQKK